MKIIIAHQQVDPTDRPDDLDVLAQADLVQEALTSLGHQVETLPCTLNLEALTRQLNVLQPDLVFNLVESLGGHDRLLHLFPWLLESLNLPYTGAPAQAILTTTDKLTAKQRLHQAGLPTPAWQTTQGPGSKHQAAPKQWLLKSVWEHASIGMDSTSLLSGVNNDELGVILAQNTSRSGATRFAEAFIPGREFNLALLAAPGGPQVLHPAEILFEDFGDRPHLVDYRAKWEPDSFEYQHTRRSFAFNMDDRKLLIELERLARACWQLFGLRGYGRVDFRVDEQGQPWILEINTNPCLSADAGFAAALEQNEISRNSAIKRIINDALRA